MASTQAAAPATAAAGEAGGVATPGPSAGFTQGIAVAVMVLYAIMMTTLVLMRDDEDWDHLVYLQSGFEAIVFAAVGWVFGTSVARGAVQTAKQAQADAKQQATEARADAGRAREESEHARGERDATLTDAERGRALAAGIKAKQAPSSGRAGARAEDTPTSPELAELTDLARRLFPD